MPSSQILPLLWIGDEYAASAPEVQAFGYVLIITIEVDKCCSSILADEDDDTTEEVFFRRFPIFDYGGEKQQQAMFDFFSDACVLIQQGMAAGRHVLVHCVEGKQRSCAVVAAYLIWAMGLTTAQAKDYIVQKRPEAFESGTHVNFAPALERRAKLKNVTTAALEEKNLNVVPAVVTRNYTGSKPGSSKGNYPAHKVHKIKKIK